MRPMKITTRLLLAFLAVSVLPLILMALADLRSMKLIHDLAIQRSTAALRNQGETAIHQKAQDVARQVELYIEAHPDLLNSSPQNWAAIPKLVEIAVQPVGQTGYTALYDDQGIVYAHANPKLVGQNMNIMAAKFPAFWQIFSASLDGNLVANYYDWPEADGSVRQKYMSCVPVENTTMRIAATTYIDEFLQPVRQIESEINQISSWAQQYQRWGMLALALLVIGLALWQAWSLSRPIVSITAAAAEVESGRFDLSPQSPLANLQPVARRKDELGQLAQVFQRMAGQVQAREDRLKQEVYHLRIEIDDAKRRQQVEEITETEYFRQLVERAEQLRQRKFFQEH